MSKRKACKKSLRRLDDALWKFNKAISIVETVYLALDRDDIERMPVNSETLTLKVGLKALRKAREALDYAIIGVSK